jgi:hypothetical protein
MNLTLPRERSQLTNTFVAWEWGSWLMMLSEPWVARMTMPSLIAGKIP